MNLNCDVGQHRSMVRRPLPGPHVAVDGKALAALCEFRRQQDMIDAHPQVSLEGVHAVVPPGEASVTLFKKAEAIRQPELKQGFKCLALRQTEQHLPLPHLCVMDVTLFGRNVEITKNSKAWMGRQLVFEP